jgi:hypothetical protein
MTNLTKTLFVLLSAGIMFTSCGGDDIAKLSDTSKKAMDEASKGGCECLKTHGKDIKTVLDELKPVLAEAEKSNGEDKEIIAKILGPMMIITEFGQCLAKSAKRNEAADKAMEEDLKKILGDNTDPKAKQKKRLEILQAYLSKNCPNEAKTFEEFMNFDEQMNKIFKKR